MKKTSFALVLIVSAGAVFGQTAAVDPLRFLPPAARPADDAAWLSAYTRELLTLSGGAVVTRAAVRSAEAFCRVAAFPADPALAARLVHGAITQADLRLRRGEPVAAVRAAVSTEWEAGLKGNEARAVKNENAQGAEKRIKRDLSIAGDKDQSLPGNRARANKKIEDKIKEKKEK